MSETATFYIRHKLLLNKFAVSFGVSYLHRHVCRKNLIKANVNIPAKPGEIIPGVIEIFGYKLAFSIQRTRVIGTRLLHQNLQYRQGMFTRVQH